MVRISAMANLAHPLVCFDLDGTLVDDTIYIWKTLHEAFDTDPARRRKAHDDYFAGRISYREWFENDLHLLDAAKADLHRIREVVSALRPMPGARDLILKLKSRGHKIAVVSGSLDIVVDELFGRDLFDHVLINHIRFDKNGRIAGGDPTPFDLAGKADGLAEVARREGVPLRATAFVGDNENDVWIARAAGLAIAFNCKSDALRAVCRFEVMGKEISRVADLLD